MEFFKIRKQPIDYENINHSPDSYKLTEHKKLGVSNQEDIFEFIQKLQLNLETNSLIPDVKDELNDEPIIESLLEVGVATRLDKTITLVQMAEEYKSAIINQVGQKPIHPFDEEEEKYGPTSKSTKSKMVKTQQAYNNSIASVNHDSMHEVLQNYKHYQDIDTYQVPLAESFFLNNKKEFLKFILKKIDMYLKTRSSDSSSSCDSSDKSGGFHPLIHQDVVKQYLNATSPYRGLLLFHGLGSGKTCTSIGIIEAMKQTNKTIYILTPASLRKNYQTQMMFCGSELFRKTEKWQYVEYPTDDTTEEFLNQVMKLTGLPMKYLKKRNGVFLIQKDSFLENYDDTSIEKREAELEEQIQIMIAKRFKFISYNGITSAKWKEYQKGNEKHNPFHNSVVIIDEGHNFVSRIYNKLKSNEMSVSTKMYNCLTEAENCNVVVLSGTPYINYPSELGVLFNMITGNDVLIQIAIKHAKSNMNNKGKILESLKSLQMIDSITFQNDSPKLKDKSYGILTILKNPYGFIKHGEDGQIRYDFERGSVTNYELQQQVETLLKTHGYLINDKFKQNITEYKRFPDTQDAFNQRYFPNGRFINKEIFQNKLVGYVSYIGDKRELMPNIIVPDEEELESKLYKDLEIFIEEIPMTRYALQGYAKARSIEKEMDKATSSKSKSKDKQTSSYQIFSRSACNFVFPENIERPYPKTKEKMNEDDLEDYNEDEKANLTDGRYDVDESGREEKRRKKDKNIKYKKAIEIALSTLEQNPEKYFESSVPKLVNPLEGKSTLLEQGKPNYETPLSAYSPKFERILQHIMNQDNRGLHLLYSNFRTLEGIGIFKMVLDYHGYTELKIKRNNMGNTILYKLQFDNPYYENHMFGDSRQLSTSLRKRKFYALYTGKEEEEDKEMIRNIFNGQLDKVPPSLRDDIVNHFYNGKYRKLNGKNNMYGDLIKLLIISSSGAEGIDLKNVRFVHIMEPYWHPVRIEQVVGRARRICSHKDLPPDDQTVKVFMYLLVHIQLLLSGPHGSQFTGLKQVQDYDRSLKRAISTDERLYMIMQNKKKVMEDFLTSLKISAIDCKLNYEDKSKCFSFYFKPNQIGESEGKSQVRRSKTLFSKGSKGVNQNNDED